MCVHRIDEGICKKFSIDGVTSYCVDGPCKDEVLTNADRIRSMGDEELAKWFLGAGICIRDLDDVRCDGVSCKECRLNWLRQPAEEE